MAKYRMVQTDFWKNPVVSEEMTPEDKYFFLYLLTNQHTTQIGIYKITKREMAFDMGYSIETIHSLMDRMINHHQIIRYNPQTRELAIKSWGKYNCTKGGKPVIDCILSELKEVVDTSLIEYVADTIDKGDIQAIYSSFIKKEETNFIHEDEVMDGESAVQNQSEDGEWITEQALFDDTFTTRSTIRGQKEKENKKEKEKQQQQENSFNLNIVNNLEKEKPVQSDQKKEEAKEILECWDQNGFGLTNVNAKEQLLAWLEDSSFLNPKDVILKAMHIGCANNKRRLNYVVGILKNWENESLLTIEEIELYNENKMVGVMQRQAVDPVRTGRDIPKDFVLDLTAGED